MDTEVYSNTGGQTSKSTRGSARAPTIGVGFGSGEGRVSTKNLQEPNLLPMAEDQVARYQNPDNDPRGPWKSADYTCRYTTAERPNLNYPIIQPNTGEVAAVTTAELDFFADWYDVASAAARSINQRQKDGRGGCNETKKGEFLRFMCDHAADIRKLMGMGRRYASYLNERSQQIVRMCNKGNYFVLAKIEAFCSKYL